MSGNYCDPLPAFGENEQEFLARLTALDGVTVWVGSQGWWPEGPEFVRPKGWPTLDPGDNEARLTTFQEYRDALCLNTGMPVAVVDVDPDNGGDIEKVRALLARLGVRIFAEVDTPGSGKHFYVAGHPDLVSTHSTADNQMLPGFPGVDVQSFGCNVFLPGTLRPKHDGRGYTIVSDELDRLPLLREDDDGGAEVLAEWVAEQRGQDVKAKARKTSGGAREWAWDPCEPWDGTLPDARQSAYLDTALAGEVAKIARTAKGGRNQAIFVSALKLGSYIAGAGLDEPVVIAALEGAARRCGYTAEHGELSTRATIRSGLRGGKKNPRAVPDADKKGDGEKSERRRGHRGRDQRLLGVRRGGPRGDRVHPGPAVRRRHRGALAGEEQRRAPGPGVGLHLGDGHRYHRRPTACRGRAVRPRRRIGPPGGRRAAHQLRTRAAGCAVLGGGRGGAQCQRPCGCGRRLGSHRRTDPQGRQPVPAPTGTVGVPDQAGTRGLRVPPTTRRSLWRR
jgi:hypothetical protein